MRRCAAVTSAAARTHYASLRARVVFRQGDVKSSRTAARRAPHGKQAGHARNGLLSGSNAGVSFTTDAITSTSAAAR